MRPSVEEFSIIFSESASSRSEDLYKKVGCSIFNKEGRLLSIGYNGFQSKQKVSKKSTKNGINLVTPATPILQKNGFLR